ncbi:unnamed protein product [Polarella glacialis]|uniref:Small ribosomal subunit protein uS17 N-terminal domain-containing protein n=1 Tax=Polarella glacialis TaxID=89957 RepID=A0A813FP36_POLGL|nr:unnamed protein product [Polarella glacialis]
MKITILNAAMTCLVYRQALTLPAEIWERRFALATCIPNSSDAMAPVAFHAQQDQTEKSFQKQDAVFIGSKRLLGKKSKKAKEGNFVDKKCPFTGNVSIRGKIIKGMCISNKMGRTIVIRRNYLHYVKKLPSRQ